MAIGYATDQGVGFAYVLSQRRQGSRTPLSQVTPQFRHARECAGEAHRSSSSLCLYGYRQISASGARYRHG